MNRVIWCGRCDEKTRLLDMGDSMARCPECHPMNRQQLKQNRKCPVCHATVYDWDYGECGKHAGPTLMRDRRPEREKIRQIVAKATQEGNGNGHSKTPPGNWSADLIEPDDER